MYSLTLWGLPKDGGRGLSDVRGTPCTDSNSTQCCFVLYVDLENSNDPFQIVKLLECN